MQIFEMGQKELVLSKKYEKKDSFKCCTFGATSLQDRHLATGAFKGRMETWDLERADVSVETNISEWNL